MTYEIETHVLSELEHVGSLEKASEIEAAAGIKLKNKNFLNRINRDRWEQVTKGINDEAVVNIFRAMVVLERTEKWVGGSVASAIFLYRILVKRRYQNCAELADWALRNRGNEYVPFGFMTFATSLVEFEAERLRNSEKKRRYAERVGLV